MADEELMVRCTCGWERSGSPDEVVAATQEHGRSVHNMDATRDEVLAMAVPPPAESPAVDDVRIVDNPTEQRYEAHLNGRVAGISEYTLEPGATQIVFVHTEVDPAYEGQGIGSRLAAGALADVRARGLKVVAECPFIGAYLRRHARDYEDIVGR